MLSATSMLSITSGNPPGVSRFSVRQCRRDFSNRAAEAEDRAPRQELPRSSPGLAGSGGNAGAQDRHLEGAGPAFEEGKKLHEPLMDRGPWISRLPRYGVGLRGPGKLPASTLKPYPRGHRRSNLSGDIDAELKMKTTMNRDGAEWLRLGWRVVFRRADLRSCVVVPKDRDRLESLLKEVTGGEPLPVPAGTAGGMRPGGLDRPSRGYSDVLRALAPKSTAPRPDMGRRRGPNP